MLPSSLNGGGGEMPPPSFYRFPEIEDDWFNPLQTADALRNVQINCAFTAKSPSARFFRPMPQHDRTLVICGGGPSMKALMAEIANHPGDIIAVNESYDYLLESGRVPDMYAMLEVNPLPGGPVKNPQDETKYFLSDISDPENFSNVAGRETITWHPRITIGEERYWRPYDPSGLSISGSGYTAIRCVYLGLLLGYRSIETYGLDGCWVGDSTHAYVDRRNRPTIDVWCAGKQFTTTYPLAQQVDDMRRICLLWGNVFSLKCHGEGLMQHMHRTGWPGQYEAA